MGESAVDVIDHDTASKPQRTILFVSHAGLWSGGAEVVLEQMGRIASDLGFAVAIAAPPAASLDSDVWAGARRFDIPLESLQRTAVPLRALRLMLSWMRTTLCLIGIIRKSQADIVHANSGVSALASCVACALLRRPLIWHQHDIVPARFVNRMVLSPCGHLSARIIAVSGAVARSLFAVGIPPAKIRVVHNAIRTQFLQPLPERQAARAALDVPENAFLVAIVGRVVPYKGHRLLLEAAAELRGVGIDVSIVIAGEPPRYAPGDYDPFPNYRDDLVTRASHPDLAGHVLFLGQVDEIHNVLAAVNVLAVPSENEPFPLVVLEAFAAGVPVVASDSGGHPEAIENEKNGLLFRSGDRDSLVATLRRLVTEPQLASRLAAAGRVAAEQTFSEAAFSAQLAQVYAEVGTANRPAASPTPANARNS
jgi:glycosyltransferase involved in cell wall biosynthesis